MNTDVTVFKELLVNLIQIQEHSKKIMRLERKLNRKEYCLVFQRTQVHVLAPTVAHNHLCNSTSQGIQGFLTSTGTDMEYKDGYRQKHSCT